MTKQTQLTANVVLTIIEKMNITCTNTHFLVTTKINHYQKKASNLPSRNKKSNIAIKFEHCQESCCTNRFDSKNNITISNAQKIFR